MKVIEVTHPIQENQYISEDVAMAFGFFDGMHKGHAEDDQIFSLNTTIQEDQIMPFKALQEEDLSSL